MNFHEFRKKMFILGYFTPNQVYTWHAEFDKNNLVRWEKKGLLVKLRNSHYSFPEFLGEKSFSLFIANRIYRPSYVSLHTALSFYGLIPESVVQITSVSTLKTATFQNPFGTYSYQTVQPRFMFGFETRPLPGGRSLLLARPEKALFDLLYLYPFYNTEQELTALRIDPDLIHDDFDIGLFRSYIARIQSKTMERRSELFLKVYGL
jgi:predicted transcriptional regulator of viral defense system